MKENELKSKIIAIRDFILMIQIIWDEIKQYYKTNSEIPQMNGENFISMWENNYKFGFWKDKYELYIRQPKKISVNEIKTGFNYFNGSTYIANTFVVQMNLLNPIKKDYIIIFLRFDEDSDNKKIVSEKITNLNKIMVKLCKKTTDKEFVQKIKESFNII